MQGSGLGGVRANGSIGHFRRRPSGQRRGAVSAAGIGRRRSAAHRRATRLGDRVARRPVLPSTPPRRQRLDAAAAAIHGRRGRHGTARGSLPAYTAAAACRTEGHAAHMICQLAIVGRDALLDAGSVRARPRPDWTQLRAAAGFGASRHHPAAARGAASQRCGLSCKRYPTYACTSDRAAPHLLASPNRVQPGLIDRLRAR